MQPIDLSMLVVRCIFDPNTPKNDIQTLLTSIELLQKRVAFVEAQNLEFHAQLSAVLPELENLKAEVEISKEDFSANNGESQFDKACAAHEKTLEPVALEDGLSEKLLDMARDITG